MSADRRRDAEAEALQRLRDPEPLEAEALLDLLERMELSPAGVDLVARGLGVDWRPTIAPQDLFDPGFRRLYIAIVEADAAAQPHPERPPLSCLSDEALAAQVAPGGDPATSRALKSALPKWRGTEAYLQAVHLRRAQIEAAALAAQLVAIAQARGSEAETRRMKEAFFLELMTRMTAGRRRR